MPKTREQKSVQLNLLKDKLSAGNAVVIAEFSGLTMEDLTDFRRKALEHGVRLQVAKNTLLTKAAIEAGIPDLDVSKVGRQLAIATGDADEVTISKLVYELVKGSNDRVKIYSGILDGKVVPVDMIVQLAQLPSRDELLAKVVGSIYAPVSGFVRVLSGPLQGFYNVVKGIQEAKS